MTTISTVPSQQLTSTWGTLTASCDHPHRVVFNAGNDTPPLVVDGFTYTCNVAAYRDGPSDPNPRQRRDLGNGWYILATDLPLALSAPGAVSALDRHEHAFAETILPEIGVWLAGQPAADLVAEGTVYWRRECAGWAASTETDLVRAHTRLRHIRDSIAACQIPSDDDERFLRYARVQPR
jgi:hypothetical protein